MLTKDEQRLWSDKVSFRVGWPFAVFLSMLAALALLPMSAQAQDALQKYLDRVEQRSAEQGMVLGNPQGKTVVYKWFDYNCGYCRKSVPFMDDMIRAYPDLKVVVIDSPVLGNASYEAAIALSELPPDIRRKAHYDAVKPGRRNATWGEKYFAAKGLAYVDPNDTDNPKVSKIIEDIGFNKALFNALGFEGTPGFIIGRTKIGGFAPGPIEKAICGYDGPGSCPNSSRILLDDAEAAEKHRQGSGATLFSKAAQVALVARDTGHLNDVCWKGGKAGYGREVLPACDRLMKLAPGDVGYRDSRGLARALSGDTKGAIADFEAYIAARADDPKRAETVARRREVVAMMKTGRTTGLRAKLLAL